MPGPSCALRVARASVLQWLFVNVYEAVVGMPARLADEYDRATAPRGPLAPGSPARYHLPVASVVLGSSAAAVVGGLRQGGARPALVLGAASTLAATALTGYLVATVNLRLLDDGPPIGAAERHRLVARWHAVNRVRIGLLAVAAVALERAATDSPAG